MSELGFNYVTSSHTNHNLKKTKKKKIFSYMLQTAPPFSPTFKGTYAPPPWSMTKAHS